MNVNHDPLPLPDADPATDDSVPAAKPVRRRRAVKVSDETASASADTLVEAADTLAKAPRARRKPVAVDAEVVPLGSAPAALALQPSHASAFEAPEPTAPDVLVAVTETGAPIGPVAGEFDSAAALSSPTSVETATSSGDATQDPIDPASGDYADSPRGRRRGRRDRTRADRDEGAGAQAGATPGEIGVTAAAAAPPVEAGELFAQVVSGEFDIVGEPEPAPVEEAAVAPKRVLLPEPEAPKLHKLLAQSGIGSRRDMEDLIADGHVSVNGTPAHVGQRVSFGDQVKINGKPVRLRIVPPPPRIIAYHKPVGEIVTHDDPQNRPTVFRRLPRLQQGKWQSVGRLDINTEGLLLFTNSGELANQLMHPRFGVEREYAVRLLGTLTEENTVSLLEGVDVEGQKASFRSIVEGGGDGANHWYRVVITEGRNREVRKLFDTVGLTVSRLIRIRYGTVVLPLGLKRGVWVDLEEGDVRAIRRLASGENAARDGRSNGRGNEPRSNEPRNGEGHLGQPRNERRGGRPNDRPRGPGRVAGMDAANPSAQPAPAGDLAGRRDRGNDAGAPRDDDFDMDFDPASIPNPLEQTFDKRFVQNPRSPAGGRGFRDGGGGFGAGGSGPTVAPKRGGGNAGDKQPDPLQTSLGVFGADAFHRKNRGGGGGWGGGGGRGGNRGGSGGSGGGYGGGGFGGAGGGRKGR